MVIEARGERLRIELNGVTTSDVRDDRAAAGLLGIQLRAGTTKVRLRNLRIRLP